MTRLELAVVNAAARCALVALLVCASACADSVIPTEPTIPSRPTPSPVEFPAVSRPARIYLFANELSYPVSELTKRSRYVLYDDGTFALQYVQSRGSSEYRGMYKDASGLITFEWEGWSAAGQWGATGSLSDDSLSVRYNEIMELTDFENAIYARTP
jgi:hypothetical protein